MKTLSPTFTIFNNEHAIFIAEPEVINAPLKSIFLSGQEDVKQFLDAYFNEDQIEDIILYGKDSQKIFKYFRKYFKFVKAAGGSPTTFPVRIEISCFLKISFR